MFCTRLHTCQVLLWGTCQRGPCWANPMMTKKQPRLGWAAAPRGVLSLMCHMSWQATASMTSFVTSPTIWRTIGSSLPHHPGHRQKTEQGRQAPTQGCKDVFVFTGPPAKWPKRPPPCQSLLFRAALSSRTYCNGDVVLHVHCPKGQPLATCEYRWALVASVTESFILLTFNWLGR